MGVKKSESQKTDQRSVKAFKVIMDDDHWTTFDIGPDYAGIDQRIEIVDADKHTTRAAFVQLKGRSKLPSGKSTPHIAQKIEVEHLDYYDKMREPVFLVVMDTRKSVGYYAFIQKYIDKELRNSDWRSRASSTPGRKPTVTIRVPTANRIDSLKGFRSAIDDAIGYLAKRSIRRGLEYEREEYERLDPRFRISITATEKSHRVHFEAIENVRIDFEFGKTFSSSGKLDTLIGRGLPVKVAPGDIQIKGSPLLETIISELAERGGDFRIGRSVTGHVNLIRIDQAGVEVSRHDDIPCTFEGGPKECRFEARTKYDVLSLRGTYTPGDSDRGSVGVNYNWGVWHGKPLLNLPYFDLILNLFAAFACGDLVRVEYCISGMPAFSGTVTPSQGELDQIRQIHRHVERIAKARWVARTFRVNPLLPIDYDEAHEQEIEIAHDLLNDKERVVEVRGVAVSGSFQRIHIEEMLNKFGDGSPTRLIHFDEEGVTLLGATIPNIVVERQLTFMRLDAEKLRAERDANPTSPALPFWWHSTDDSRMLVRRSSREVLDRKNAVIAEMFPDSSLAYLEVDCGGDSERAS